MAKKSDMGAAFGLSIAAGIIILIASIIMGLLSVVLGAAMWGLFGGGALALGLGLMIWGLIDAILVILGAFWIKGGGKNAKTGAILVLIFGILGFFTPGAGFIVGPILGIIGGAIGISKAK